MPDTPQLLFMVAAGLAAVGVVAHELVGSAKVLGPLKDSGLPLEVVWLHHFSWHVGSVAVAAMIALFLLAAWQPQGLMFSTVATAMSAGFAMLGIGLAVFGNRALWRTPAPYPWALVAMVGGLGLYLAG